MSRPGTSKKWQPQTAFYDYNYGVGINFYQPMIDYIEQKERGGRIQHPHLPWTNELGLNQFDPNRLVKSYSCEALDRISRKTEASAKARLRDFTSLSKSAFQLNQSVTSATITEKIQTKKTKKKEKELIRQIDHLKAKMYDDDYDPDEDNKIVAKLRASQKFLRGRSARGIEAQLLAESHKNIAEGIEIDQKHIQSRKIVRCRKHMEHVKVMDEKITSRLEESFTEPLDHLSAELKGFNTRTAMFYYDKSRTYVVIV